MVEVRNENRFSLYLRQFKKIDLLIIDELGYVTFDLAGAELLFQLLATRYETMSTIITSNLGFSDWVKVFHDRALTAAILDRITHPAPAATAEIRRRRFPARPDEHEHHLRHDPSPCHAVMARRLCDRWLRSGGPHRR
jgi:DNA replication protein DnaC